MIKKWSEFNESRSPKIDAKIELLKDLSLDLSDMGLKVDIWNGTWKDDGGSFGVEHGKREYKDFIYGDNPPSKSIIMMIEDYDGILDSYYENELKDKKEILDFEEVLKSYKMIPRKKSGFGDKVYLFFDKQGKMTNSDLLST